MLLRLKMFSETCQKMKSLDSIAALREKLRYIPNFV